MRRSDTTNAIGRQIKAARESRGLTQRDLAERVGVQYQLIQSYERGEKMSLARLVRIARELKISFGRITVAIALASLCWPPGIAIAGERLECFAERLGKDWHYRTKVPGFNGDVRGDRCWYDGPSMKPRAELYWPDQAPVEMIPLPPPRPVRNEDFEERWEGLSAR